MLLFYPSITTSSQNSGEQKCPQSFPEVNMILMHSSTDKSERGTSGEHKEDKRKFKAYTRKEAFLKEASQEKAAGSYIVH